MKRQYIMPAMQELDVTLRTAIMSGEDDPKQEQTPGYAPSRKLYI